ncbi:MAG: two-component system sensor histidine kinase/response regulator, partial [Candidatus Omnitrophica bacterium]|nr:two-component system sensor histidine kinase/response regulator [Candidatus Omnitrophota bacterium]
MTKKLRETLVSSDKLSEEVSVRKRAEKEALKANTELNAVNKELEAFSYSVSHDLRAPLRHISGFVELLQKSASSNLDEKSRRYIGLISDSAKRMGNLIDDLLTFSRVGRFKMVKNKVNLSQVVKNTIKGINEEIKGRNITWKIKELPEVSGD